GGGGGRGAWSGGGGGRGSVPSRIPRPARRRGPPVHYFGLRASRSGIGLSEERSILSMPRILPDKRALAREGLPEDSGQAGHKSRLAYRRCCCKMSAPVP